MSLVPRVARGDPRVLLGLASVASCLLQVPAGAVVALGGLLGRGRRHLGVEVGLDELRLDRVDVVGCPRGAVLRVVHLLLARVHVVATRVGGGRGESPEARDQGEGECGDADSMHGWFLLGLGAAASGCV
jgi:hypothetical protein